MLAHEIAHVIIEGERLGAAASQRVSGQIGGLRSESGYRRLELLCDEAAREILIPLHLLRPLIQSTFRDSNIRHQCQKAEALPQGEGNVILMLTFE